MEIGSFISSLRSIKRLAIRRIIAINQKTATKALALSLITKPKIQIIGRDCDGPAKRNPSCAAQRTIDIGNATLFPRALRDQLLCTISHTP
jgi:hypothetical protein